MKGVFFSDIDNTIYDFRQEIHPQTVCDVNWAAKQGVMLVLATGNGLTNNVKILVKKFKTPYSILLNGSLIYDWKNKRTIYKKTIPGEIASSVINLAVAHKVSVQWWEENSFYFSQGSDPLRVAKTRRFLQNSPINFANQPNGAVLKIELIADPAKIDQVYKLIAEWPVKLVRMLPRRVEIVAQNVTKASAIKWFCQNFNVSLGKIGVIGDSPNDLEMLSLSQKSYAVANAQPEIQKIASLVVADSLSNGVGQALRHFVEKTVSASEPS
ncbi:Cof-type HAD-IIB family hydrolase [Mycoplasma sp. ATU-Cv-508]|uniref:Cof-type HAD-IIB family hydrolase n=1 Tax=Mycoplasma sp. ATU-Cv-508 TaxID=2048001 RepID=UPI000FDD4CAD